MSPTTIPLLGIPLILLIPLFFGSPPASDLQSVDCWTSCSSCKMHCPDRSCQNMCENINRVCCSAGGKRPYLSGCGCHSE